MQSGWLCRWFMASTSLNTWAGGCWSKTCSLLERRDPSRWKRYWNQIKSLHNDPKDWIILVTELNVMIFISGFRNNPKGIYVQCVYSYHWRFWPAFIIINWPEIPTWYIGSSWFFSDLGNIIILWRFWGGAVGMAAQMAARNKNWRLLALLILLETHFARSADCSLLATVPGKGMSSWGSVKAAKIPN